MSTVSTMFEFFGVTEAAAQIGISTGRLRQLLRAKKVRGKKVGDRAWVIPGDEIERLKNTEEKRGRPRVGKKS